ncbi:D-alanyl-D-alanine carboxypeptidase family protein [Paenibacillus caui]|uniref:D-alanyl-D-alanine carboxypeptidase family protein n=1 Tax=Paenibacillus caui TaxID=2873927 RepID=UPI001CA9C15D|nr:D-alanyl-D-alanine carboxypeptidase family protein [Paenibacillus caui]
MKRKLSKRRKLKKAIASLMLLQMLCLSVAPAAVMGAGATTNKSATTTTTANTAAAPAASGVAQAVMPAAPELAVNSAILLEPTTGQILYSMNSDEALPPASMTKMMTEYIVADMVKKGKLGWDTKVTVKENAEKQIGSRVFLAEGEQYTVKELYIAMAVGSANDATVALAEFVAGSEQNFVKMMNDEAKRMGLPTAYFANSTGLSIADMPQGYLPESNKETVMSAMDAAILAKYIVEDHPDFSQFTTIQSYKFRQRDKDPIVNYNWMLPANASITNFKKFAYPGLDGMKTGHTSAAGQCFTGTAVRNGVRLISVVMGADTEAHRFTETAKLLDYGFNNFELKKVGQAKSKLTQAETIKVKKGKQTSVSIVTDQDVNFVLLKGADANNVSIKVNLTNEELTAPVKSGAKVGTATYSYKVQGSSQPIEKTVNLVTAQEVEKAGWFKLLMRAIGDFFRDLFNSIKNLF